MADDPRIAEAHRRDILKVWSALGERTVLRKVSGELVGPCPVCGGRDRFAINTVKQFWNCRICASGGDQLALVQHVLACDFPAALTWLCGEREVDIDPAEQARRDRRAAADQEKRDREAARYRQGAIRAAREIWGRAQPAAGTAVEGYFEARGIPLGAVPDCLRFIADHPYVKGRGAERRRYHSGPAMIAAVTAPGRGLTAVHQTWIDLSAPKGRAEIFHPETGEKQAGKLVRGSKQGGAIRLHSSARMLAGDGGQLVVGEGIETTATAWTRAGLSGASFWAGIDLGHMAGRMRRVEGARWSGLPDMGDEDCLRAPKGLTRLYYIMDGDSEPKMTRAKLECGLRRAAARQPGLETLIVHPGEGVDLNDLAAISPTGKSAAASASGLEQTAGASDIEGGAG